MGKLNHFAVTLKDSYNEIHRDGYGLDNSTDLDFFTGSTIRDMAVNQTLIENPEKIGASSSEDTPSNNENAQRLYDLKDQELSELDGKNFINYYIGMVSDIAYSKDFHSKMAQNSQVVVEAVEKKLEEIGGVNMDEELVSLMQLQNAYQAAAKVITVTDELLQTVMNMV